MTTMLTSFVRSIFDKKNMGQAPTLPEIHLYQIAYSEKTRQEISPGYLLLDNIDSSRNDWREYWPIRDFLINEELIEDHFYGFFSPRFKEKTLLNASDVRSFVQDVGDGFDVISFSPHPDQSAFFLNVFYQQEQTDPGFIKCCDALFREIGLVFDIKSAVMDSRQTIFSNYFVAKPRFWLAWLERCEQVFKICEGNPNSLKSLLVQNMDYPGAVQRKVFLMERMASVLLTTNKLWKVSAYNAFKFPWTIHQLSNFPFEAVVCDALKIAMKEQGFLHYHDAFENIQRMVGLKVTEADSK